MERKQLKFILTGQLQSKIRNGPFFGNQNYLSPEKDLVHLASTKKLG